MLLVLSVVVTLYFVSILWFRSQCRAAIRFYGRSIDTEHASNLISFEEGLNLQKSEPSGRVEPRFSSKAVVFFVEEDCVRICWHGLAGA
jgi:hypothetical protein